MTLYSHCKQERHMEIQTKNQEYKKNQDFIFLFYFLNVARIMIATIVTFLCVDLIRINCMKKGES